MTNSILTARENRANKIKELTKNSPIISIRANLPGEDKNNPLAKLLVSFVASKMKGLLASDFSIYDSLDGRTIFAKVDDGVSFKQQSVSFEENDSLGRLTDIDVFNKNESVSLSRGVLRKCYLCDKPAVVCAREKNHTQSQLIEYFCINVKEIICDKVQNIIRKSMMTELELTQKFGLVSKTENASHLDLNYDIMKKAIDAIVGDLTKCFFVGLFENSTNGLFDKLNKIGLDAERKMFDVTNGANAYKGYIFISGILLSAVGYAINNNENDIFAISKEILTDFNKNATQNTFGAKASLSGFGGIRKEAKNGFAILDKIQELLPNYQSKTLLFALSRIVGLIDDSVLLKRAKSIEKYNYYKEQISKVDVFDDEKLKALNDSCVKDNISIGGSADILMATILLKELKEMFFF